MIRRPLRRAVVAILSVLCMAGCHGGREAAPNPVRPTPADEDTGSPARAVEPHDGESRLRNIRQLTFEGENAEAYFSGDGRQLIFQSKRKPYACDQIYTMKTDGTGLRRVSSGDGRTTCGYFAPDGSRIIYASTHLGGPECPPSPPRGGRYVWPVYEDYDIFSARPDGTDLRRLTEAAGYDAEGTYAPDGSRIVFTSARDGDLEIYSMRPDGTDQRRLTHTVGYDGGPFYSPDSSKICFRASRPRTEEEKATYLDLLSQGLVEPTHLELYVMDADGSDVAQITDNGAANFCPFFHPSGEKIIYASNKDSPRGRGFDLYLIDIETREEERITTEPSFDAFPMFSPDGSRLVWGSNRRPGEYGNTNVFVADWVE